MRHGFSFKKLSPKKSAWKSPALWAGITLGVGSVIALALAPKKGKAMREQVKDKLTGHSEESPASEAKPSPLTDVSKPTQL